MKVDKLIKILISFEVCIVKRPQEFRLKPSKRLLHSFEDIIISNIAIIDDETRRADETVVVEYSIFRKKIAPIDQ